jgi:CDP-diacylglycerol--glycerol-3-phosphate 3-phosphatidyltransferase
VRARRGVFTTQRHGAMSSTVSAPLRQLPNALTIARFAAIPLFVVLLVRDQDGPSWPAGVVFGLAAITDQLDGFLARRWRVESAFGKVADPLADRLMIDVCVVLLVVYDRLPWVALVILLRDLVLVGGYKLVVPRGYEFEVSLLGKIATWGLYASLALVLVTERDTWWPLALFWISLALAVLAAVQYVAKARREVAR